MPRLTLHRSEVGVVDEIDVWYENFIAELEKITKVVKNPRLSIEIDNLNINFIGLMKSLAAK